MQLNMAWIGLRRSESQHTPNPKITEYHPPGLHSDGLRYTANKTFFKVNIMLTSEYFFCKRYLSPFKFFSLYILGKFSIVKDKQIYLILSRGVQ